MEQTQEEKVKAFLADLAEEIAKNKKDSKKKKKKK